jgi:hypothetical protein
MIEAGQIRDAASQLPERDRAELAAFLIEGLKGTHYWVDDEEIQRRRAELDSGEVQGLTEEEFWKACGR